MSEIIGWWRLLQVLILWDKWLKCHSKKTVLFCKKSSTIAFCTLLEFSVSCRYLEFEHYHLRCQTILWKNIIFPLIKILFTIDFHDYQNLGKPLKRTPVFFNLFCSSGNFSKCLGCSGNPTQWSKCLYCYNHIELWLRILFQENSVCFGRTPGNHLLNLMFCRTPVEKHCHWKQTSSLNLLNANQLYILLFIGLEDLFVSSSKTNELISKKISVATLDNLACHMTSPYETKGRATNVSDFL